MISVYQLKSRFQDILRPLCKSMAENGITANMVTITAFVMSVAAGLFIYFFAPKNVFAYLILPFILFVRMALNAIDGMLAREHNQKSNLGAILNELGDILSDCAIYVPFLYVAHCDFKAIFLFTVLTVISETIGIMGIQVGASRHYEGPMGKSDRAFWMSILAIVLAFVSIKLSYLTIFIYIVCALLLYTSYNRIVGALKEAEAKAQ